ncbi:hypothetical protein [Atopococcus tabaci]|uniref:hypothetical protein n=1 Tax=Atopococcus tabaci TaxID=269774 RepID=UPI0004008401|nr:hypothetical protein [Atopococcus tabaci]
MSEMFTQMRPVFMVIAAILVVFTILALIERSQSSGVSLFAIGSVSVTGLLTATALLVVENQILEEMGWTGDPVTLYFYLAIVVLSIANPLIYRFRNNRKKRYTFY